MSSWQICAKGDVGEDVCGVGVSLRKVWWKLSAVVMMGGL